MPIESAVFEFNECPDELFGQRIGRRKAPLSVVGDSSTEQMAIAVGHYGRIRRVPEQIARQAKEPQ